MMRDALAGLRTIVWTPVFYGGSLIIVLLAVPVAHISPGAFRGLVRGWGLWHRGCARWLLGQRVRVEGMLPDDAVFLLFKHESMFETIDMPVLLRNPAVFAKQELFSIPLWGRLAARYGLVPIEREAGAKALRAMRRAALDAVAAGRPLVLFPEGTRVPHGQCPPLRSGFAGLYRLLGLSVLPVAVDSGRLRKGWLRLPGTVTYRVGEPIPPGLPRAEAEALAHRAINMLNGGDEDGRPQDL